MFSMHALVLFSRLVDQRLKLVATIYIGVCPSACACFETFGLESVSMCHKVHILFSIKHLFESNQVYWTKQEEDRRRQGTRQLLILDGWKLDAMANAKSLEHDIELSLTHSLTSFLLTVLQNKPVA